jgi:hypothetical protein
MTGPRNRAPSKHFVTWARVAAGVVLLASVIAVVFFAGFFTERDYGDILGAVEGSALSVVPAEDTCIQTRCKPAGRFGQHCTQYRVPC